LAALVVSSVSPFRVFNVFNHGVSEIEHLILDDLEPDLTPFQFRNELIGIYR
jgi:hypothetical protein